MKASLFRLIQDVFILSDFDAKVLREVSGIPRGEVRTYKQIAKNIRRPRAYRQVARTLSRNPFPLVIPCHRVVSSSGRLSGYQGGKKLKGKLLVKEGCVIDGQRVVF